MSRVSSPFASQSNGVRRSALASLLAAAFLCAGLIQAEASSAGTLTMEKDGTGQGTVTSSPAGINCGTGCTSQQAFFSGSVTLTATPASGSDFAGWPGCDSPSGNSCTMNMANANKLVLASFSVRRTLNFSKFGQGTVTSSPAGVNCGSGCTSQSPQFSDGAQVTLTATPAAGWVFAGWPGCDNVLNNGSCRMTMTSTKFLEAHFVEARTLNFSKFGQGTVTSSPAGINCGTGCSSQNATYGNGTEVTLTATPAAGWVLAGWPGCDNVLNNGSCKMNMTSTKFLEAHFVQLRTVNVAKNGTGTGTVTSSPSGINCGNACSAQYGDGTEVTFTATPDSTSTFAGWSGCDTVTNAGLCRVTANGTENVSATFALKRTLTVLRDGSGTGGVASSPAGISCAPTCSAQFTEGQSVSLQPTPSQGSVFGGWTGCDTVNGNVCTVAMSSTRQVTATFTAQHVLGVVKSGSGGGTVTSSPGGIACGSTCSAPFNQGTTVTLTAAPDAGSLVGGWTGCDSTTATTCTVAMDDAAQVTASFVLQRALTVTKGGSGAGSVSSSPAGISCGVTCEAAFADGATVVLTATPTSGSDFAGWTGCDSTNGPTCTVAMNAARGVTAAFAARRMLTVTKSGTGTGTVGSSPAGINCGATCAALFGEGQAVVLVAAPAQGSSFAGWTGCDSVNGTSCSVAMTGDGGRDVVATFTKLPPSKTAPNTTITSGPKRTRSRTVTFKFSSSLAGSVFRCSLDGGKPVACRSPKTYANLAVGKHTFSVFAVSRGVSDPTPAVRTFRILPRRRR